MIGPIEVTKIEKIEDPVGGAVAMVSMKVWNFLFNNIRIVETEGRTNVLPPSARDQNDRLWPVVTVNDKELKMAMDKAVLEAWSKEK